MSNEDENYTHNWRVATAGDSTDLPHPDQDEGVLSDVLSELDRERTRRAELEARLRKLSQEKAAEASSKEEQKKVNRKDLIEVQTERDELTKLIDALTSDNDAISSDKCKLPLHVRRLLEIIPWDERVKQYTFAKEEVIQWQVYDRRQKKWSDELRTFPAFFKTMPIAKPEPGRVMEENESSSKHNRSKRIFGGERPPKQCVMTDSSITLVLNVSDGYPLPNDGATWTWIAGWRIDKRVAIDYLMGVPKTFIDCDEDGWSYTSHPSDFLSNPAELCWDNPGSVFGSSFYERGFRFRQWSRRRALLTYPHASERTEHYLKLMADSASFEVTSKKLNEQLVATKIQLTECEEKQMNLGSELQQKDFKIASLTEELAKAKTEIADQKKRLKKVDRLESDLKNKNGTIRALELGFSEPNKAAATTGESSTEGHTRRGEKVEKIKNALGGMISEASSRVRFKSDETTDPGSDGEESSESSRELDGSQTFDWKKIGPGVLNKIKASPVSKSLTSFRKPSEGANNNPDAMLEHLEDTPTEGEQTHG